MYKRVMRLMSVVSLACVAASGCGEQVRPRAGWGGPLLSLLGDDTRYAEAYTEEKFFRIRPGMTEQEVRMGIGDPLTESLIFDETESDGCRAVFVGRGQVQTWFYARCAELGVQKGMAYAELRRILGEPKKVLLIYSDSPANSHYRQRLVELQVGRVTRVITGTHWD